MKRFGLKLGLLGVAIMLFAACEVTITPGPGLPPGLRVYNESFETDYEADLDRDGDFEFVICDDRTTNLTYSFRFEGDLDKWESYLNGETDKKVGRVTLDLGSDFVNYNPSTNTVRVNYEIRRGGAPNIVAPQGIVPTPKIDRYVRLYLEIDGYAEAYDLISKDIPVLAACG